MIGNGLKDGAKGDVCFPLGRGHCDDANKQNQSAKTDTGPRKICPPRQRLPRWLNRLLHWRCFKH
ncbi:hypothetical protein MACH01_06340 [Thalassospira tepidiphila]|nr:hypothetical protein MACH01_06340 [Thalassospira tepidiphila]